MSRSPARSSPPRTSGRASSAQLEALVSQFTVPALIVDHRDLAIHHNDRAQATLDATPEQLDARPVWDFLDACHALETALANTRRGAAPGATVTVASRSGTRLQATLIALREAREATLVLLQEAPAPQGRAAAPPEPEARKLAALGTIVASVMHELRTPLAYARNNLEIARMDLQQAFAAGAHGNADAARIGSAHAQAIEGIERASSILAELRPLSQNRRPRLEPADLGDIAQEAAQQFTMTEAGGARIALDLRPTREVMVDKDEILAAVHNLLRNAAEASGERGVVTVQTLDKAQRPCIRVVDHGPGVAPEDVPRLFEPFRTTKPQGTGLGLFIARQAVVAHGGALYHEVTPGGGATFTIEFAAG